MLLTTTACGGGDGAGGGNPSPSGASRTQPVATAAIEIQVRVGEQCHPEPMTPEPSCRPQPRPNTLVKVVSTATEEVIEVRTEADGTARVAVGPGTYVVRADDQERDTDDPQQTVTVAPDGVAHAVLTYLVGFQ